MKGYLIQAGKGFTLIEMMLVVVAITTLIAATTWFYASINAEKGATVAAAQMSITTDNIYQHFQTRNGYSELNETYAQDHHLFAPGIQHWPGGTWRSGNQGTRGFKAEEWLTTPGWRIRAISNKSGLRPAGYNPEDGFQVALIDVPRPEACITIIDTVHGIYDVLLVEDVAYKNIDEPFDRDSAIAICNSGTTTVKIQGFRY